MNNGQAFESHRANITPSIKAWDMYQSALLLMVHIASVLNKYNKQNF
jgi:hypothetical protein